MSEKEFSENVIKLLLSKEEIEECKKEESEFLCNVWKIISDRYNYLITERKIKDGMQKFKKQIFKKLREVIKKEE